MREDVLVTPRGRREHKFKHISPGGTTRFDEYFSPAALEDRVCDQRFPCLQRMAGGRRAAAPAAAERKRASFEAEPPRSRAVLASILDQDRQTGRAQSGRFDDPRPRCKDCTACEFASVPGQAPQDWFTPGWTGWASFCRQHAPCEEKLSRMDFRHSEFATVYELQGSYVQ